MSYFNPEKCQKEKITNTNESFRKLGLKHISKSYNILYINRVDLEINTAWRLSILRRK